MINSVADFLLGLKDKEQELLKKYDIVKHPGIIGDMYEGLTKDILSKSIFKGLDIRITAGKIKNSKNEFSGEIDCMIVVGDGEQIPYTDKFIYDSKSVIAVIQVKKNLFSKDLKDSYQNLKSVTEITESKESQPYHYRLLRDAWTLICREELPKVADLNSLPTPKQMMYQVLLDEVFQPVRIVWGYNGFKSEFSLRESFINYLEENVPLNPEKLDKKVHGFGPLNFPNLIICDQYSLIKSNGMPFGYPLDEDNWWAFFNSSYDNPVYFLLEVIWTRLHYMFGITSEIFGDDLTIDAMHGFLLGRYKDLEQIRGWEYFYIPSTKEELERPLNHKEWEPTFVDQVQFIFLNRLCKNETIDIKSDSTLIDFLSKHSYTLDFFIKSMKDTGLVDTNNGVLKLITQNCVCGITADGKFFAGDNKTGRVTRWTIKNMSKKNAP
jgi:hypothetical protein